MKFYEVLVHAKHVFTFYDLCVSGCQLPGTTAERRKPQWYAGVLRQKVLNTLMLHIMSAEGRSKPTKETKERSYFINSRQIEGSFLILVHRFTQSQR